MKQTDYNDFADRWILLNHEVKAMHNHSLKSDWQEAGKSAKVCAVLAGELQTIFKGYNTK
jgi:hypothetical protein